MNPKEAGKWSTSPNGTPGNHLRDERDAAANLKTIQEYANPMLLEAVLADVETARKRWKLDVS